MKYALNIAEDRRILSATFAEYAPAGALLVDYLPEGDISDYRYIDEQYVYDPLPEPEEPEEPEPATANEAATWDELAAAIREGVNTV